MPLSVDLKNISLNDIKSKMSFSGVVINWIVGVVFSVAIVGLYLYPVMTQPQVDPISDAQFQATLSPYVAAKSLSFSAIQNISSTTVFVRNDFTRSFDPTQTVRGRVNPFEPYAATGFTR